jgi:hypothetical protein
VVPAFADVAGQDAFGEVGGVKGHDAEGTAFGDRVAFCNSGSDGQRGGEGEHYHADEGGAELHCGWLRAINVEKVSMYLICVLRCGGEEMKVKGSLTTCRWIILRSWASGWKAWMDWMCCANRRRSWMD